MKKYTLKDFISETGVCVICNEVMDLKMFLLNDLIRQKNVRINLEFKGAHVKLTFKERFVNKLSSFISINMKTHTFLMNEVDSNIQITITRQCSNGCTYINTNPLYFDKLLLPIEVFTINLRLYKDNEYYYNIKQSVLHNKTIVSDMLVGGSIILEMSYISLIDKSKEYICNKILKLISIS